ncbi:MAG: CPXCG motif-containing cysteine-rich protein, partial [Bacteroidota bacterium]|nr:CPXCG motif-containing cysteine-rich protein [Bacteroidota bacterium]
EPNETFVDESAGPDQEYTEDCQVCCRPNVLRIHINEDTKEVIVSAEFEE